MSNHTPGPWKLVRNSVLIPIATYEWAEAYGGTPANARLIAAAPKMYEALHIQHACGSPQKVSLYDEMGVEGWRWTHPDGREWTAVGSWDEASPMHPVASAALSNL